MEEAALDAVPGISLLEVLLDPIQMAPTVRGMCKAREAFQTDRFYHPTRRNLFPAEQIPACGVIESCLLYTSPSPRD